MKCYLCKKEVSSAVRKWMEARNGREKDGFRDLCSACYSAQMMADGYVLLGGPDAPMWTRSCGQS